MTAIGVPIDLAGNRTRQYRKVFASLYHIRVQVTIMLRVVTPYEGEAGIMAIQAP